jgi:hypothetical protein
MTAGAHNRSHDDGGLRLLEHNAKPHMTVDYACRKTTKSHKMAVDYDRRNTTKSHTMTADKDCWNTTKSHIMVVDYDCKNTSKHHIMAVDYDRRKHMNKTYDKVCLRKN